jgi:hypothetical protein
MVNDMLRLFQPDGRHRGETAAVAAISAFARPRQSAAIAVIVDRSWGCPRIGTHSLQQPLVRGTPTDGMARACRLEKTPNERAAA